MGRLPEYVWLTCFVVWSLLFQLVYAINLDIHNPESIKQVSRQLAWDLVRFYIGNNTGDVPGNLPSPYYWWEAGAFFGTLINYWHYTGDSTYNTITKQAILHQAGTEGDFMPTNQTRTEGNDDQAFWAFTAMMAAETNFLYPPDDSPSWLAMVQAVFNKQASRWENRTCGGGLKWQIFPFNTGYDYRNSISNGCFFNMAARLARYTGNATYAEWASKVWDWTRAVGLIDEGFRVFDGTSEQDNCTALNRIEWTYNNGVYLHGAAHMWNHNVIYEYACEIVNSCKTDQFSFKGYLVRWMGDVARLAPWTHETIMARLQPSAQAAAAQCVGGQTGTYCGMKWTTGAYDGTIGVGQQMSALEVIQVHLLPSVAGPLTNQTGGTSQAAAGTGSLDGSSELSITTADRVGAGIITMLVGFLTVGSLVVMVS